MIGFYLDGAGPFISHSLQCWSPCAKETQRETSVSQSPGCFSPARRVRRAHGLTVPSRSALGDVYLFRPSSVTQYLSLTDQLIDVGDTYYSWAKYLPLNLNDYYGPDVWNTCHFLSREMKVQNESLEDSPDGSGFAPDASRCPVIFSISLTMGLFLG